MAKVRTKAKAQKPYAPPPPHEVEFESAFKNVADNFVHLAAVAREQDEADVERIIYSVGGLCMGMWLELHRIADAMEVIAEPLASMVEERHA
jgi:hypothetical protein